MVKSKDCNSIDLLKFLAALFVVAIHAQPFSGTAKFVAIDLMARWAVPFFFIASSYFYFRRAQSERNLSHYVARLGQLYLFWFLVESPITVLHYFIEPSTPFLENLLRLLRDFFLGSTFGGSWFLMSLIVSVPVISALSGRLPAAMLWVMVLPLYALSVCSSSYAPLLPAALAKPIAAARSVYGAFHLSWTSGLLFCLIGHTFASFDARVRQCSRSRLAVLFVCAMLIFFGEMMALRAGYIAMGRELVEGDICWSLPMMAAGLFAVALRLETPMRLPYRMLRACSTLFYFSHFVFVFALVLINKHVVPVLPGVKYIVVLLLCSLTSIVVLSLSRRPRFGWLRRAY